MRSGLAHVGVAALDIPPEQLEAVPLTSVEQVLVVPREHRLAKRGRASLANLADEPMVVPPPGRPHRAMLESALRACGGTMKVGATARGWELTLKLVELGFGIAVVNGCCRVPRTLVRRPLPELPAVHYVAFTRPGARRSARALVRTLAAHASAWRKFP